MARALVPTPPAPEGVPTDLILDAPRTPLDRLTSAQREVLLHALAQFRSYGEIQALLRTQYGVSISARAIAHYVASPKWRIALRTARQAYLTKTTSVPIAHQVVRMERYEAVFQAALAKGQTQEALQALRSAAEEMGKLNRVEGGTYYIHQQIAMFDRQQCEQRLAEMAQAVRGPGRQLEGFGDALTTG